jgi:hypothetical protein
VTRIFLKDASSVASIEEFAAGHPGPPARHVVDEPSRGGVLAREGHSGDGFRRAGPREHLAAGRLVGEVVSPGTSADASSTQGGTISVAEPRGALPAGHHLTWSHS